MSKIFLSLGLILTLLAGNVVAKVPEKGDKALDFSIISLSKKEEKAGLSDFRGKVLVMGMFHICVPCMNQAMELEKVRKALPSDKLAVIGVNTAGDSGDAVKDYLKGFPSPVTFPYYLDPKMTIHKAYIQRDMPTVLIIGADGVILSRSPAVSAEQLIEYLKMVL
jgi:cytochrome c biogenesis protein CcmG/thiol:disulfide interchange protein DsbE